MPRLFLEGDCADVVVHRAAHGSAEYDRRCRIDDRLEAAIASGNDLTEASTGVASMTANRLGQLQGLGQSVWLDYIDRALLETGELTRLIQEDAVSGVTSNPAIFGKAIASGGYDGDIARLARGRAPVEMYDALTIGEVQRAAELLRPVYDASGGRDGYVSLEVSPRLADDTAATIAEGQRLAAAVARANLMIKVPATRAGLPAIRALLAQGINVNVTLLFGRARYRDVVEAFLAGLEDRTAAGRPLASVASVASFFLSRIDTLVDARLDRDPRPAAAALRGRAAIASARLAYSYYKEWTIGPRWRALVADGARPQRLLWASTSTKDPAYADVKYVDALIGPDTVTTLPPETLRAYRDHGEPAARLTDDLPAARALPAQLAALGIDLEDVATVLEQEGVRLFVEPYDRALAALTRRVQPVTGG